MGAGTREAAAATTTITATTTTGATSRTIDALDGGGVTGDRRHGLRREEAGMRMRPLHTIRHSPIVMLIGELDSGSATAEHLQGPVLVTTTQGIDRSRQGEDFARE